MSTVGEQLRWLRAALLSAVASLVGISGHVYAGGLLPDPVTIGALYVMGVVGCAFLLGQPASTLRVIGLTIGGQVAMHTALSLSGGHVDKPAHGFPSPGQLSHELSHLIAEAVWEHGTMTLVHIAASLAVALWLAAGERALWSLLSHLTNALVALVRRAGCAEALHLPVLRLLAGVEVAEAAHLERFDGSLSRRGPPLQLAA